MKSPRRGREKLVRALAAICLFAALGWAVTGCGSEVTEEDASHAAHDHVEGPHGGAIADVTEGVHMEAIHDPAKGTITIYLLGGDAQTPVEPTESPLLNLKTDDGPVQIAAQPAEDSASEEFGFLFADEGLKNDHIHGQVAVSVEGRKYFVAIPHHHDHGESGDDCDGDDDHEGHDHDHAHDHGANTISRTVWTDKCEWFVELETPEKGQPAAFAAHVTLLDGFAPAESGSFTVAARSGSHGATAKAGSVARPGIFTPEITFPETGEWVLTLTFDSKGITDSIDWTVAVHDPGEAPEPEEDGEGLISFLKEAQWKIAFATAWSETESAAGSGGAVFVHRNAVLSDGDDRVVLVQIDGESFEARKVETGLSSGSMIEIGSGLEAGERVVVEGGRAVLDAR